MPGPPPISALAAAQNKLLAALPDHLRAGAEQMRARFHLDAPDWFAKTERPAYLQAVADAVWRQSAIRIHYQSWKAKTEREVEPLGLVLKGGAWYLVAQVDGRRARTYRIARILALAASDRRFDRPASFDLEQYWRAETGRLEADLHRNLATIRLSPRGLELLEVFASPYVRASMRIEEELDSAVPASTTHAPGDTSVGDFAGAFAAAPVRLNETYTTPGQTHAMMEPHASVAAWEQDRLTVWTSHQMIDWGVGDLATTLGIPKQSVRIISPYVGGGFGGKPMIHNWLP